jgi:hypothetical protein
MQPLLKIQSSRLHHYVYVVVLDKQVLKVRKFIKANPNYKIGKPCLYVGMTGLDPDTRFDKHKAGIKANSYVQKYGLRLAPEFVADLQQPMCYEDARYLEVDVALKLKEQGFAVWQA